MPRIIMCLGCDEERPHKALGLCLQCYKRKNGQEYYQRNKEKIKARARQYYWDNHEEILKKDRARNKRRYRENKEKILAWQRAYYAKYPERCRAACKKYYENNKEKAAKSSERWRKANPEKSRATLARRYARKRGLPDTLTGEQLIRKLSIGHCFYCGEEVELTLDHFVALGADDNKACGTTQANSVVACQACNSWKGTKMPEEILMQFSFGVGSYETWS